VEPEGAPASLLVRAYALAEPIQRPAPMSQARLCWGRWRRCRDRWGGGDSLLRLHPAGELEQQLRGIELLGAAAVEIAAE
jgi:hypothetical protein